jgi:DNA repair protein RadC
MYVLFLDNASQVLGYNILSSGGITGTVADLRLIFSVALESLATKIIIAHNHPSGNLNPSEADTALTRKIYNAGKVMDITLLDHLIITVKGYYSFADEGNLG